MSARRRFVADARAVSVLMGVFAVLQVCGGAGAASASDTVESNRLEYRLTDLEGRASEMAVTQAVLRQEILDAGPALSRATCEQKKQRMMDRQAFKFMAGMLKTLESRDSVRLMSAAQGERLAAVKLRIAMLKDDAGSVDCKALAPLNP